MAFTFTEYYEGKTGITFGVNRVLFSESTPYQKVEVLETDSWGRLLTVDDMVMLSEQDEFVYHEMIAHVPLNSHPKPEKVLIVGGGDGGTAREVLRHEQVTSVDLVEIDEAVVRASQEFLRGVGEFDDPRLTVTIEDGIHWVEDHKQSYDVIIVDGSDPVGPAEGLFNRSFFESCYNALHEQGILVAQSESPWVQHYHEPIRHIYHIMDELFDLAKLYLSHIPLYPTGMWAMTYACKGQLDPLSVETEDRVANFMAKHGEHLRYYNQDIHHSTFALPQFVRRVIGTLE
ncbi:MAG: polyamine aminopropyltransferase [Bacteroidota bacterium]